MSVDQKFGLLATRVRIFRTHWRAQMNHSFSIFTKYQIVKSIFSVLSINALYLKGYNLYKL